MYSRRRGPFRISSQSAPLPFLVKETCSLMRLRASIFSMIGPPGGKSGKLRIEVVVGGHQGTRVMPSGYSLLPGTPTSPHSRAQGRSFPESRPHVIPESDGKVRSKEAN